MEITSNKILLVEGRDEVNFFEALCDNIGVDDIQIIETGGKDKFKNEFPVILLMPNFEKVITVAIIQDADVSKKSTVDSINYQLKKNNFPSPVEHAKFNDSGKIKCGIFVMPGNRESGMLENLVLDTVDGNLVKIESEKYIDSLKVTLEENQGIKFPKNEHKARLHAYLAGMERHVSSLGLAAKSGCFNLDSEHLNEIKNFLKLM